MTRKIILLFTIAAFLSPAGARSKYGLVTYSKDSYKFNLLIPDAWRRSEIDLGYKHVLIVSFDRFTEIKITATGMDVNVEEKWDTMKDWFVKGIGTDFMLIMEQKKPKINSVERKVLVFQYRHFRRKILKRVLINKYSNKVLVVECSAPVKSFYFFENTFNRVMKSVELEL